MSQPLFFIFFFYTEKMQTHLIYFFARYGCRNFRALWDKLVTLYMNAISIRLPLQYIKRYVVAVCLMHHMRPCSFRCRYVFMSRFESFYSFENGWKCRSKSHRHLVFRVFIWYRVFVEVWASAMRYRWILLGRFYSYGKIIAALLDLETFTASIDDKSIFESVISRSGFTIWFRFYGF